MEPKKTTYIRTNEGFVNVKSVIAIRKRNALPEYRLGPAIIINFGNTTNMNSMILEFKDEQEQEAAYDDYIQQLALGIADWPADHQPADDQPADDQGHQDRPSRDEQPADDQTDLEYPII